MLVQELTTLLNQSLTLNQAKQIHAIIITHGLHHLQPKLIGLLTSSHSYSGLAAQYIQSTLHQMQKPDTFSGACTIRFLTRHGQFKEAIAEYAKMHRSGLSPTTFAISSTLKACARVLDEISGISIHAQGYKYGLSKFVYVQTALVDFYSKLGYMETARLIFDEIKGKNVVSWNSMLAGYIKSGDLAMAECLFTEMPEKDVISWNSLVSGYGKAGEMEKAYSLFREMPERNHASWNAMITGYVDCGKIELARGFFEAMPERNNVSCIAMIGGYSKRGDVDSAQKLFDQMGEKDRVMYNAIISCYVKNNRPKEAVELFNRMVQPGANVNANISPDKMTLASVISACSQMGDMGFGSWIESYMGRSGISMDDHLATAFIDLYAKCGAIDKAYNLFCALHKRDLVSYTAMILGCGINGKASDSIKLFKEMMDDKINPNLATFVGILTAYNHYGLVEEGYYCFKSMKKYGLKPTVDHYGIMVDLLGRAGRLEEGYELIKSMPMKAHAGVWGALLLACSLHNNVEIGEIAAKNCMELEPEDTGYHSLLANIYASAGRWEDAKRLKMGIGEKGFLKVPGCSWTENG